jgi:hypothetical protein
MATDISEKLHFQLYPISGGSRLGIGCFHSLKDDSHEQTAASRKKTMHPVREMGKPEWFLKPARQKNQKAVNFTSSFPYTRKVFFQKESHHPKDDGFSFLATSFCANSFLNSSSTAK